MSKIEDTAVKVADNAILTAGARIAVLVGIPVTVLIGGFFLSQLTGMHQKVQALEVGQERAAALQGALHSRLSALETQNTSEATRFASIEREISAMVATQAAMNRTLDRVLNRLDGGR